MQTYFNIKYEFDQAKVDEKILDYIGKKSPGYVCSLDMTNLAFANTDPNHLQILNSALVNNCDSTWVPTIINSIYGTKYTNYCGMDLFVKYIKMKRFRQFFLGSTPEVLQKLKQKLLIEDPSFECMRFESLPFNAVEDFDYLKISQLINEDSPDIIWVSLGVPKQEKFMNFLLPHLKKGIMFGFGAIFVMYAEIPGLRRAPKSLIRYNLEWLFRLVQEPRKQISRVTLILKILPSIIIEELKRKREIHN